MATKRVWTFIPTAALVCALSLFVVPAFAQDNEGENPNESPAMQSQDVANETDDTAGDTPEGTNLNEGEGAEDQAGTFEATIVVGEDQKREYNGKPLGDDEYYVELTYDANGQSVRFYVSDTNDVSGFTFKSESGEVLEGPPVDAGMYTIGAQILATTDHASKWVENAFEITKKLVPVPTAASGLTYNGEEQTGIAETDLYTVEGGTATEAGNYTARLVLRDPKNYAFATADGLNARDGGFFDIAWAIGPSSNSSDSTNSEYSWEVTPYGDSGLMFGSMNVDKASSVLAAKVMAVRDSFIGKLSYTLMNLVKLTRALFPATSM